MESIAREADQVPSTDRAPAQLTALEATQEQTDGLFGQLPCKCHLEELESVGYGLNICPNLDCRVVAKNLIMVSTCKEYSVGPPIQPICIRCWFRMTNTIQVCSEFH